VDRADYDSLTAAVYAAAEHAEHAEPEMYKTIRIEISEAIATLTVDRPDVKNALNLETVQECRAALAALAADETIGVLIITGGGESAFVSGADINDIRARGRDQGLAAINSSLFAEIERFPRPTIAAINGYALGGGCELALACDIRISSETARFGQPELGLGIIPGAGATQRLPRIIGMGRAKHLILTGEIIDARQALEMGLVSVVTPAGQLQIRARELAKKILKQGPLAARLAKIALNASARVDLDSGLLIETLAQAICYSSEDKAEGTTAFLEKRKPKFTGR
jgi:enoyl-CoA hydratase/carnithine racemase